MLYDWLVLLHVLSAIVFFMAHGASAAMAFQIRRETELSRIRAILDLSNTALPVAYFAMMFLMLAGIGAGIWGNWFNKGWIWAAIVLLLVMWFGMHYYAFRYFTPIRKAVGLPYRDGKAEHPAGTPASENEIAALIKASNPFIMAGVYLLFIAVILWLMILKPF